MILMNDPNRLTKWLLVIGLVVLSLLVLYPPSKTLKGGIDLVGGSSLLYEIDTTGLDSIQQRELSTRVMAILKERVDPKGQLNLEWRPVGNSRLEVRMPRPPKEAIERRAVYNEALAAVMAKNLRRFDVESALIAEGEQRKALLEGLHRGIEERTPLIEALTAAHDAYIEAQAGDDTAVKVSASDAYEDAMAALLHTSLPIGRFTDILNLTAGEKRTSELDKLHTEFPSYDSKAGGRLISQTLAAYDAWAKDKADLEDPSDLKRLLRGAGVLEFRILADRDPGNPGKAINSNNPNLKEDVSQYREQLARYGPRPQRNDRFAWFRIDDVVNFLRLKDISEFELQKDKPGTPIVEEYAGGYYVLAHNGGTECLLQSSGRRTWSLKEAYPDRNQMTGQNIVSFRLDPRGGALFGDLTGENIERSLCIMLDNSAMSFATIQSRITERGQISGKFTAERVQNLVRILEAGSLPARLKETPLMENTVGPSLGETNRTKGMRAAISGTVLVILFMLAYYGVIAGGMADVALAMNLLLVLAIMALLQATFTLPGIAGLILTVGMAVDANVLIFERIREETSRGIILKRALNAGYDKAFSTIVDANITTLITCVILGFVGSEEVKGFAITLGIGITTSMFTSLFVTRLVFNTLISNGWLKRLHMRRIIGVPNIDWMALRRKFWPVSITAVVVGTVLFVGMSSARRESMFDIEFLGGTSLQVDLKPGVPMTDEEMDRAITGNGGESESAAGWLASAAVTLGDAKAARGEVAGVCTLTSTVLTGDQLAALLRPVLEDKVERGGFEALGHTVSVTAKGGQLTLDAFEAAVADAATYAAKASERLRSGRVQSVGEVGDDGTEGHSYEIVTIETSRELVQAAVLAVLGDDLQVQRGLTFSTVMDDEINREPFFVIEPDDHYLSDVFSGEANYDIRRYRNGVAIEVVLDPTETPQTAESIERRLREVGLSPEFEQYRTRESSVIPLGQASKVEGGGDGYMRFAIVAVDENLLYEGDGDLWKESLARSQLSLVEAALGQEKSLSKVIQFAPQIAGQTKNRAVFAIVLALAAIVAYLWLRFGTKEYGLAAIVALVHDVMITLGLLAVSQLLYGSFISKALMLDAFRIDLPMIAAILTVIGYSLNDTIVVFDRIRENKGRVESLNANIINNSLNQTLSRTLLTSITTFIVVAVLYAFGGKGVHGFSFALLIGVIVGTYSSLGVATPLLYRPRLLHSVVTVICTIGAVGAILAAADTTLVRLVLVGLTLVVAGWITTKSRKSYGYRPAAQSA